ncbi:class I SAM-dependent methyltransferase [Legionella clemsonensis]|uniref:Glycine/sarcosine/dimethylglycine N-methyltransferase n=1 Tax=Legionella clemsonensis TaxID=1867846 RepID=A0A222P0U2_9GAMM|nr:methyltransferase domain-containing protein [Legionella clemsonensis]ASQ45460.1 Glycine/sarcosine/dimethylglycine N-methyltransferase [Legionella clemsonensis]
MWCWGTSRYLAYHYGCQVFGLDITQSRIEAAIKLTALCGLSHLVKFQQGDATCMPFANQQFDRVIGQEAWVHIADKKALFSECKRVLKPCGKLGFTDVVIKKDLTSKELLRLHEEMACYGLITSNEYEDEIKQGNLTLTGKEDLSSNWANILSDRLKMYRNLKEYTIKKFGEEYFLQWDKAYAFYVDLFVKGKLGGMRFIAQSN